MTFNQEKTLECAVVGFLFDPNLNYVALIEKQRPDWQKGLLNGIGGHREKNDELYPVDTMIREFEEEAGVITNRDFWQLYASLFCEDKWRVHCFRAFSEKIHEIESKTNEEVSLYNIAKLPSLKTIPNLKWLIPLAMDLKNGLSHVNVTYDRKHM